MTDPRIAQSPPRLVIASGNPGKVREFIQLLAPLGLAAAGLADFSREGGLKAPPEPAEDGETFFDNARTKARACADALGAPCLADDSGLCVRALGGAPGVKSARYGGEGLTPAERNELLLEALKGAADRRAWFQAVLVLAAPWRPDVLSFEGRLSGEIALSPRGDGGFGYDPVFWLPEFSRSAAELSPEDKNAVSHRGRAVQAMAAARGEVLAFLREPGGWSPMAGP
jgi:XTP/dITP diphosphohydrolase